MNAVRYPLPARFYAQDQIDRHTYTEEQMRANPWLRYEYEKARLPTNLTGAEYDAAIRAICDRWNL